MSRRDSSGGESTKSHQHSEMPLTASVFPPYVARGKFSKSVRLIVLSPHRGTRWARCDLGNFPSPCCGCQPSSALHRPGWHGFCLLLPVPYSSSSDVHAKCVAAAGQAADRQTGGGPGTHFNLASSPIGSLQQSRARRLERRKRQPRAGDQTRLPWPR